MTRQPTTRVTGAEDIRWDLGDLYAGPDDPQLRHDRQELRRRSEAFAARCRSGVRLTPHDWCEMLAELEALEAWRMRINAYSVLGWTANTHDPVSGNLYGDNDVFQAEITENLRVFEHMWAVVSARDAQLADDPALAKYRHYLARLRQAHRYRLPEKEENLVHRLSSSGVEGWVRFYHEHRARWHYHLDGNGVSEGEIDQALDSPDRDLRRRASDAVHEVLRAHCHTSTFIYNMVLLDKGIKDDARGYGTWLDERNLKNEVLGEDVDALTQAVTERYDLAARYYLLHRRVLGLDELLDFDLYAPLPLLNRPMPWDEAKTTVLAAFAAFSGDFAAIAGAFFERRWVDAAPAEGKVVGAYCSSGTSSVHPYILLNFRGQYTDLFTLAHELGHGIHYYLAREQGQLQYEVPDTLSELASNFCELLVFHHLMARETDPAVRFALRMRRLQSVMTTVFQQVSFHRFEHAIHTARRTAGELTTADLTDAWHRARSDMYGDSVTLRAGYGLRWARVPHFLDVPGYVHTYAYGELLAWSLCASYVEQPRGFTERYQEALRLGASESPQHILGTLELNPANSQTWNKGLSLIEAFLSETEAAAVF